MAKRASSGLGVWVTCGVGSVKASTGAGPAGLAFGAALWCFFLAALGLRCFCGVLVSVLTFGAGSGATVGTTGTCAAGAAGAVATVGTVVGGAVTTGAAGAAAGTVSAGTASSAFADVGAESGMSAAAMRPAATRR